MKKIILALLAIVALAPMALQAKTPRAPKGKTCTDSICTRTGARPEQGRQAFNPFEGIELTAEQQQAIAAIAPCGKKCDGDTTCTAAPEAHKCDKADCKKDGASCGQSCGRNGSKHGHRPAGKKADPEARAAYLAKVKEILTPEQYTQFLENLAKNPAHNGKARADRRGGKRGHRGNGRPAQGAACQQS